MMQNRLTLKLLLPNPKAPDVAWQAFLLFPPKHREANSLKIIPVMDILNGAVVHAVRGNRKEYQPLKSSLVNSAEPLAVASAFRAFGFKKLYVADLDAILGNGKNFSVLKQITDKTGLSLMVDAGVADLETAHELFGSNVSKVIIGTETLPNLNILKNAIDYFGNEKVVVSLDLKGGKVLSKSRSASSMNPLELARELRMIGVAEIILLDLARVGSGEGVDFALLKEILGVFNGRVIVGGGVRSVNDLSALRDMDIYGVLLATALHSGKITVQDLRGANLL